MCIMELFGGMGLNCGAEDAEFRGIFIEGNVTMECVLGENVTAHLYAEIAANSAMRYDFGIVVALDAGTGESGMCANFNLEPVSLDNTDVNVIDGNGPFYNAELANPADTCGDARSADGINTVDLGMVTFECVDRNMDGMADISGGIAWDNMPSNGSPSHPHCTGPDDVMPGTSSKCQFVSRNIDTMVVVNETTTTSPPTSTSIFSTLTTLFTSFTLTTPQSTSTLPSSTTLQSTTSSTSSTTPQSTSTLPSSTTSQSSTTPQSTSTSQSSTTSQSTSTLPSSTSSTTPQSSQSSTTTSQSTSIPAERNDIVWIIGPILGGVLLSLLLFFFCCLPKACVWFNPLRQQRYQSILVDRFTGLDYSREYIITSGQGILLHQPPFEVRISPSRGIKIINIRGGNTVTLDPRRNYAFHICNDSGEPVYWPTTSDSGILSGLLVLTSETMETSQFGQFNLFVQVGGQETKTFGTYKGPIRIKNVL